MFRTIITISLAMVFLVPALAQVANFEGNSKVDGKLTIDHPTTILGDVPITIDAAGSTYYSGLKTTYGTNSTYIFAINNMNGGIEVGNQDFAYAPVLASDFVVMPASSPSSANSRGLQNAPQIDALSHIAKIKAHLYTSQDRTSPDYLRMDPTTIPDLIMTTTSGVAGSNGAPQKAINTARWLALISEGINELEHKTQDTQKLESIIEQQQKTIDIQMEQIENLISRLEKIESINRN